MPPAHLSLRSGLGPMFFMVAVASVAGAQDQAWIRQLGTPAEESTHAAMPDGNGGAWLCGSTGGSLFEPSAGGQDYWLARIDGSDGRVAERQRGKGGFDSAKALAPNIGANFGSYTFFVGGETDGTLGGPNMGGQDVWLARTRQRGQSRLDPPARHGRHRHHALEVARSMPRAHDVGMKPAQVAGRAALRGVFLFAALSSVVGAQNQTWIRQFGTNVTDWASAAAPDGAGGVYVSGQTRGSLGGPYAGGDTDAWLARYDSAGNQAWIRQLGTSGGDAATAAAPDGSGGVYVSGYTDGSLGGPSSGSLDVWLAHYDGAGHQTWIRQFGTNTSDYAKAAASDGSGGVVVSGNTYGSLGGPYTGGYDTWLARYDSAGNRTWIRQLGTSGHDGAQAAAPDGSGGVYVSGLTEGSLGGASAGAEDAWLARYDTAGNRTWIRQLGSNSTEWATGAAPDGSGGVYVSGFTEGSLGGPSAGGYDVWLAHYDGAGNQTWMRQFGSNVNDSADAAASDGSGGLYSSGWTRGSLGGPNTGGPDAWLARYDSAGNQTWIRQLGTSGVEYAYAAAPDGSGGVYVTGLTEGSLGGPSAGSYDVWLARYDGGLTSVRYCTPAIFNSTGRAATLNATGNNVVATNNVSLEAHQLPQHAFGFFLTSRYQGSTYPVYTSQGRLCLGGFIGRYVGPGQIMSSGTSGSFSLAIDLTSMPQPFGNVAAHPGETWHFTAWHRDANPTPTSNFTDAVSVTFQ